MGVGGDSFGSCPVARISDTRVDGKKGQAAERYVALDCPYASERAGGIGWNHCAHGGVVHHRGGSDSSAALVIPASFARAGGVINESMGQDIHVRLWVYVRGIRRIHRGAYCAAATDSTRGCNGDRSGRSYDCGDVVSGGEPRFTIAVDYDRNPERTGRVGGRGSLRAPGDDLSAAVIETGSSAQLQHEMRRQFNADEGEPPDPPGGPTRRPQSCQRHRRQFHSNRKTDAGNEPYPNASRNLQTTRDGKARAQPVEKPYLHPVASERRPEHQ